MAKPHIANHYLQATIRGAQRQGHDACSLLTQADIPNDWLGHPEQLITEQQLTHLIKSVWRATRDEFLGMSSERCNNGTFALMCEYCISSATLGAVLRKSAHFYRIVCNNLDIAMEAHDKQVFFRLHLKDARNDTDHLLQEFLILMWERMSCWLVDQQIPFAHTQFNYPAPSHEAEYQAMYPGELKFNQGVCGFQLHEKYLHLPVVRNEQELREFLQAAPAYILHRPSQDESLRSRIQALLARHDYVDMPGLTTLGELLHMTPRNIGRKLQDEGTSLRKIKEAQRREHAVRLMTTENLSIAEVSEQLGFSETAAFSRAFKRWTGCSPTRWQSNHNH
ncbi:AraC family transcriptional regulator [Marinobacter sp. AL4B]|uniref:AraC family transcriptional regulator n=1 Tax=Marinobacter sp. AL4B TaxID=2871173 RepID=UPI001CAA43EE|nr:AraC family transcriptional regulator [Marinobacter sp. AL4B]MBZ0334156.1 AraC family transcriptional regulator [Marinobacter sp. AL4B]